MIEEKIKFVTIKSFVKKHHTIIKLIIILVLSSLLYTQIFINVEIPSEQLEKSYDIINGENVTYRIMPERYGALEKLSPYNLDEIVWLTLDAKRKVCFENVDTYTFYNNIKDYENVLVVVYFNKEPFRSVVENKKTICKELDDTKFTFNWEFTAKINETAIRYDTFKKVPINETHHIRELGKFVLVPNVRTYLNSIWYVEIIKFIIISFVVAGMLKGIISILIWIKKSREE